MTNYFKDCSTLDEAKSLYRKLALANHPDHGGSTATMQEINAAYAFFQSHFTYTNERNRQTAAHAEGRKTAADYHDLNEVTELLRVKIEAALNMGLDVELCGLWVWVSGNTRPLKEQLKAEGFHWAPDKGLWFFPGVPSMNRTRRTMDEIRNMHGSRSFARPDREEDKPPPQPLHA